MIEVLGILAWVIKDNFLCRIFEGVNNIGVVLMIFFLETDNSFVMRCDCSVSRRLQRQPF
jgi:hypothetical protein